MVRGKWPNRWPTECLGLDAVNQRYIIKLADPCHSYSFEPYKFGLCVKFTDGNGYAVAIAEELGKIRTQGLHIALSNAISEHHSSLLWFFMPVTLFVFCLYCF